MQSNECPSSSYCLSNSNILVIFLDPINFCQNLLMFFKKANCCLLNDFKLIYSGWGTLGLLNIVKRKTHFSLQQGLYKYFTNFAGSISSFERLLMFSSSKGQIMELWVILTCITQDVGAFWLWNIVEWKSHLPILLGLFLCFSNCL